MAAGLLAAFVVATRDPFLSQAVRAYVDIPFLALVVAAAVLEVRRPQARAAGARAARPGRAAAPGGLAARRRLLALRRAATCPAGGRWSSPPWQLRRRCSGRSATWSSRAIPSTPSRSPATRRRRSGGRRASRTCPRSCRGGSARSCAGCRSWAARPGSSSRCASREPARLCPRRWPCSAGSRSWRSGSRGCRCSGATCSCRPRCWPSSSAMRRSAGASFRPSACAACGSAGAAVLLIAFVGSTISHQTDRLDRLRDGIQLRGEIQDDLRDLTRADVAEPLLERCGPVYVPNHRPVPILAWYLDRDPDDFVSAQLERPVRGLYVAPATARSRRSSCSTRATRSGSRPRCRPDSAAWPATSRGCCTSEAVEDLVE